MASGLPRRFAAVCAAIALLFAFIIQASALEDKYRFDELKMSVKLPKDYYVITRDSDRSDSVFETLNLGYDETMIAFRNSDIYLRAYDPQQIYWISVIVTKTDESKTINNYSDISASDRKGILENLKQDAALDPVRALGYRFAFGDAFERFINSGTKLYSDQVALYEPLSMQSSGYSCPCTTSICESMNPPENGEIVSVIVNNRLKALYSYNSKTNTWMPTCVFSTAIYRG